MPWSLRLLFLITYWIICVTNKVEIIDISPTDKPSILQLRITETGWNPRDAVRFDQGVTPIYFWEDTSSVCCWSDKYVFSNRFFQPHGIYAYKLECVEFRAVNNEAPKKSMTLQKFIDTVNKGHIGYDVYKIKDPKTGKKMKQKARIKGATTMKKTNSLSPAVRVYRGGNEPKLYIQRWAYKPKLFAFTAGDTSIYFRTIYGTKMVKHIVNWEHFVFCSTEYKKVSLTKRVQQYVFKNTANGELKKLNVHDFIKLIQNGDVSTENNAKGTIQTPLITVDHTKSITVKCYVAQHKMLRILSMNFCLFVRLMDFKQRV